MRVRLGRDAGDATTREVEGRHARAEQRPERDGDVRTGDLDEVVGDAAPEAGDVRERPVVDLVARRACVVEEAHGAGCGQRTGVEADAEGVAGCSDPARCAGAERRDPKVAVADRDRARGERQRQAGQLQGEQRAVEVRSGLGRNTGDRFADHGEGGNARREERAERDGDVRSADLDQIVRDAASEPADVRERPVVDLVARGAAVVGEADRPGCAERRCGQRQREAAAGGGEPIRRT